MSTILRHGLGSGRPRVAVLCPRWAGSGEPFGALRQVVGALALSADVHVLCVGGPTRRGYFDGVVTVQETAARRSPRVGTRRDVLLALAARHGSLDRSERRELAALLDEGQDDWWSLSGLLEAVHPDLIVLADHREIGAARLAETVRPDVPVVAVPLATRFDHPADPQFAPWFDRAGAALVFSEAESAAVGAARLDLAVHHVGLALAANPSVEREPHTFVGDRPYALVLTGARWATPTWPTTLTALLQVGLPRRGVVVCATDRLVMFRGGEERQTAGVARGTDLLRLVAWATSTVDLRPGSLVARRSLESLLYGGPIIVPADSRAREHAVLGRAGLWFYGPGDLAWCVEALFDDEAHRALSRQGRHYAETRYAGSGSFVDRVSRAVLPVLDRRPEPRGHPEHHDRAGAA